MNCHTSHVTRASKLVIENKVSLSLNFFIYSKRDKRDMCDKPVFMRLPRVTHLPACHTLIRDKQPLCASSVCTTSHFHISGPAAAWMCDNSKPRKVHPHAGGASVGPRQNRRVSHRGNFQFSGVVSAGGANATTSENPWRVRFVSCSPGLKAQRELLVLSLAALGAGLLLLTQPRSFEFQRKESVYDLRSVRDVAPAKKHRLANTETGGA